MHWREQQMTSEKDKYGRLLDECPENKRSHYPASPLCCGIPMVLYFAWSRTEGDKVTMIGGHLLCCTKCREQTLDVDLITSQLAGTWVREVL